MFADVRRILGISCKMIYFLRVAQLIEELVHLSDNQKESSSCLSEEEEINVKHRNLKTSVKCKAETNDGYAFALQNATYGAPRSPNVLVNGCIL